MSTHISRPGFQLLSLVDPAKMANSDLPSHADAPCLLPDQYRIYASFYAPCLCITLLILIIFNLRRPRSPPLRKLDLHSNTPSPRSSGRNTPNTLPRLDPTPWSAVWPPFLPMVPVSPRSTLPPHLRTPHPQSTSATHLVASLPGSPMPASPTSLAMASSFSDRGDPDDDDTMYPAQYALRRHDLTFQQREKDEWSHIEHHGRDEEEHDQAFHDQGSAMQSLLTPSMHQSEFISAPDYTRGPRVNRWSWSYTFVYRGRRRRISVGLPSWNSVRNLLDLFGFGADSTTIGPRRRRGGLKEMSVDALSIFWPAIIVWLIINWTILSN